MPRVTEESRDGVGSPGRGHTVVAMARSTAARCRWSRHARTEPVSQRVTADGNALVPRRAPLNAAAAAAPAPRGPCAAAARVRATDRRRVPPQTAPFAWLVRAF